MKIKSESKQMKMTLECTALMISVLKRKRQMVKMLVSSIKFWVGKRSATNVGQNLFIRKVTTVFTVLNAGLSNNIIIRVLSIS